MTPELLSFLKETLDELEDYLDNRADVDDGIPNTAMRLFQKVRRLQEELK